MLVPPLLIFLSVDVDDECINTVNLGQISITGQMSVKVCACDILLVCADDRITGQMSVLKCPLVTFSPPLSHDPLLPGTHRCAWVH